MLAVAIYAGLYLSIGKPFLPTHGPAWAIVFIWFCALVMGYIVDRVSLSSHPDMHKSSEAHFLVMPFSMSILLLSNTVKCSEKHIVLL